MITRMYPYARNLNEVKAEILFDRHQLQIEDALSDREGPGVEGLIDQIAESAFVSQEVREMLHDSIVTFSQR